jgi:hypothetical protein
MWIKGVTDTWTETASYKLLTLGNNVHSIDSMCFLICYCLQPSDPLPFVSNGRGTHRFVQTTVSLHYTDTDPTILTVHNLFFSTFIHMFLVLSKFSHWPLTDFEKSLHRSILCPIRGSTIWVECSAIIHCSVYQSLVRDLMYVCPQIVVNGPNSVILYRLNRKWRRSG